MTLALSHSAFLEVIKNKPDKCAVYGCEQPNTQVAQIIDGRLFAVTDVVPYGFAEENGCRLCKGHLVNYLQGHIPPAAIRRWIGVKPITPQKMNWHYQYDRLGNQHRNYIMGGKLWNKTRSLEAIIPTTLPLYDKLWSFLYKFSGIGIEFNAKVLQAINPVDMYDPKINEVRSYWRSFNRSLPDKITWLAVWDDKRMGNPFSIFACYDEINQLILGIYETMSLATSHHLPWIPSIQTSSFYNETHLIKTAARFRNEAKEKGYLGVIMKSFHPFHFDEFDNNVFEIKEHSFQAVK